MNYYDSNIDDQKRLTLLGEKFLRAMNSLIQTVKLHQDDNPMLIECAQNFICVIDEFCSDDDNITIRISNGKFFLQNEKFPYRRDTANLTKNLLTYFEKRELSGLRFYPLASDSQTHQIIVFARLLNSAGKQEAPLAWITRKLESKDFIWVEIYEEESKHKKQPAETDTKSLKAESTKETAAGIKQKARQTYICGIISLREVAQKITTGHRAGINKALRITQNMVDLIMEEESVLMGLSTLKDHDEYTCTHSVNVAILAMSLGKRIGLSRQSMERLGLCGLFHDLGKIEVPHEILNKPGKLNDSEYEEIQKHPLNSVRQILKLRASRKRKAKIILPPFEHHLKYDLSGYPQIDWKKHVSLFGRIITIADVFDAITSPRIYRTSVLSPDKALTYMLEGSGKDFDPLLLKVFIKMLGIYPVGTLVRMDNNEMGLVIANFETPDGDGMRPEVMVLVPDNTGGFKKGSVVNLGEVDPDRQTFLRNIVESFHPSVFGIQPAYFLA